jgi:hypothetical protein
VATWIMVASLIYVNLDAVASVTFAVSDDGHLSATIPPPPGDPAAAAAAGPRGGSASQGVSRPYRRAGLLGGPRLGAVDNGAGLGAAESATIMSTAPLSQITDGERRCLVQVSLYQEEVLLRRLAAAEGVEPASWRHRRKQRERSCQREWPLASSPRAVSGAGCAFWRHGAQP